MDWKTEKCVMILDESLAQDCRTYDEFTEKMEQTPEGTLQYFGIAICGAKKKINKLTGSMALLR